MGQVVQLYKGLETFGHGGTIAGFKTFLLRVPSQKLSVIVLANLPYINPLNTAYEIADFYFELNFSVHFSIQTESKTESKFFLKIQWQP